MFVFIYKLIQCALSNLSGKRRNAFAFIAGIVGASVVWRERNAVNQQLCFYLVSRVLEGCVQVMRQKQMFTKKSSFSIVSVFIWGVVMYLFERDKRTLQPSLSSSMTFLYHDSDRTTRGWRDFIPLELPGFLEQATNNTRSAAMANTSHTPLHRCLSVLNEAINKPPGGSSL